MGFGLLFIGYFFLINISYFNLTDIVGAIVMLSALYRLGSVNRHFVYASYTDIVFSVLSLAEFSFAVPGLFGVELSFVSTLSPYISAFRYALLFVLNLFILRGIETVAREVDASALAKTSKASIPLAAVYLFASLFSLPFLSSFFGKATAYIYFAVILAIAVYVLSNLIVIYKAYMQICMPGQDEKRNKKAKSGAMDKFYNTLEQKGREYAEYKVKKKIEKKEKQKNKEKKSKDK